MPTVKYISKITVPGGDTYSIKDQEARDLISQIVAGGVAYIGETSTALEDGATTNPITINSSSITVVAGNLVTSGSKEFLFDGTYWHEVGDLSKFDELGDWAYVDSGSVTITPSGSVSTPTFSNGAIGNDGACSVSVPTSASTTASTSAKSSVSPVATGTTTYQPAGSISNVVLGTTSVNSMTSGGTAASWSASVDETTETLSFSFTANTVATSSAVTVGSGSVTTQPSFTGTAVRLETDSNIPSAFTTTLTNGTVTGTVTGSVTGDVSQPTFTGTAATASVTTVPHTPSSP